ncbi:MAG: hypothetical protein ACLPJH_06755 [Myxococcaceae bacterium]
MRGADAKGWVWGLALAAVCLPAVAGAADGGASPSDSGLDMGLEQRTSRAPSGGWDWAVDGSAVLPVVDVASQFRLGLRLTDAGRVEHLTARWGLGPTDLTAAQALFWNGRMDRGPNNQVALTFAGGVRLDALAEGLGLPRTSWVELGLQSRTLAADASGRTRMSTTLVLSVDFDVLADSLETRAQRPASSFRIRASAALGNDPGCNLGTPTLLFSGRCLTLALALEF